MAPRHLEPHSGHSRPELLVSCAGCGARFDAYAQVMAQNFLGTNNDYLCRDCRDRKIKSLEQDKAKFEQARIDYQHKLWTEDRTHGIPEKFRGDSFENFDATGNEERVSLLRAYADEFPTDGRPNGTRSLLIARDVNGVGKTHLACAILRRIIERATNIDRERCPYQFWPVDRIKSRLLDAQRFNSPETVTQVNEDFATMWLLILDDVGKDAPKGYEAAALYEMYFRLINERYLADLPIIVTSNLAFAPWSQEGLRLEDVIGKAGASRLMGMCDRTEYVIAGHDRR